MRPTLINEPLLGWSSTRAVTKGKHAFHSPSRSCREVVSDKSKSAEGIKILPLMSSVGSGRHHKFDIEKRCGLSYFQVDTCALTLLCWYPDIYLASKGRLSQQTRLTVWRRSRSFSQNRSYGKSQRYLMCGKSTIFTSCWWMRTTEHRFPEQCKGSHLDEIVDIIRGFPWRATHP